MLDKRDLEAIAQLFDGRFDQLDKRLDQMDNRFEQMEVRLDQMDNRFEQMEVRLDQMDSRFEQIDSRFDQMEDMIGKAIDRSEEFLLDELDRYDRKYERQFDKVNSRLDVLEQLYRPAKTEADTIEILLKTTADHGKRISRLEKLMA